MKALFVALFGLSLTLALYCPAEENSGEALWKALQAASPTVSLSDSRRAALDALDTWIAQPDSEQSPELAAYYQRALDSVLEGLSQAPPKDGLCCYQLYSSSVIIQSKAGIFAIDLDQGPNEDLLHTPEEEGVALRMRDDQITRFAELIDYSFHTHGHSDHVDFEITQALLEHGKTVIVTESNKAIWQAQPWADRLVCLKQTLGRPLSVGPYQVEVLWDHQWNNEEHSSGTPCNAYVVTLPDGLTVGTKGDINCGLRLYGWMQVLHEAGRTIDLMTGSLIYWKGPTLTRQIDAIMAPIWMPGHAWEFEHRPSGEKIGNAMPFLRAYSMVKPLAKRGDTTVLSWGECLELTTKAAKKRAAKTR